MKHRHHIIPQKAPYLEELHEFRLQEDWQVDLTVEGHACQHDVLYRAFGWKGDKIASHLLSGNSKMDLKEWREVLSENGRKLAEKVWSDPDFIEKHRVRAKETAKKQWEDPEFRQMMGEWTAKRWEEDGEYRQMMSEKVANSNRRRAEDPNYTGGNVRSIELKCIATGDTEKFATIADACRKHPHLQGSKISAVCRGKRKTHKGFEARYLED